MRRWRATTSASPSASAWPPPTPQYALRNTISWCRTKDRRRPAAARRARCGARTLSRELRHRRAPGRRRFRQCRLATRAVSAAHRQDRRRAGAAGKPDEALGGYRASNAIAERLAESDSGNGGWQKELRHQLMNASARAGGSRRSRWRPEGVSGQPGDRQPARGRRSRQCRRAVGPWLAHEHIGDVLRSLGKLAGARRNMRRSETSSAGSPPPTPTIAGWQYSLGSSHARIGLVLEAQRRFRCRARRSTRPGCGSAAASPPLIPTMPPGNASSPWATAKLRWSIIAWPRSGRHWSTCARGGISWRRWSRPLRTSSHGRRTSRSSTAGSPPSKDALRHERLRDRASLPARQIRKCPRCRSFPQAACAIGSVRFLPSRKSAIDKPPAERSSDLLRSSLSALTALS